MEARVLEKPPVDDALREVTKIRSIVTDAVEDGVRVANQVIKRGRHAAEDALEDTKRAVQKRPLQSLGAAFALGAVAGALVGTLAGSLFIRIGLRNR
jgi:ElaB/YqjD/DUF883 family membrane-anchored ribosome-binding protein